MDTLDYKLSAEEKKRRKKEKQLAKKFSDDEELSDICDQPTSSASFVESYNKNGLIKSKINGSHINPMFKSSTSRSNDIYSYKPINGRKRDTSVETPEQVFVEDVRSKATIMKASDLLKNNNANLLKMIDGNKPRRVKTTKHNDQLITYSQAPVIHGTTTLTQSSGTIMSISNQSITTSCMMGESSLTTTIYNREEETKTETVVETIHEPEHVVEAVNRIHKKSGYRLNREEILGRCNHDVARMMGKRFLHDQVCTKPRFVKLLLKAVVDGDLEKFQQLFESCYQHLRSVRSLFLYSKHQLKRILLLKLLRLFIDQGTESNIFMLLSGCYKQNDESKTISCNQLSNKHGYCKLIQYLSTFFRPSELKTLLGIRNCYSGRTAFCISSVAGNLCQQRMLLECAANANTVDDLGYSPMHYIVKRSVPRKDMFNLLLQYGSDVSVHFGNYSCEDSNYLHYVDDHCVDDEFKEYIKRKVLSIQSMYSAKVNSIIKPEFKKIVDIASALHTCRGFAPKSRRNNIELDFELDLTLLNTLKIDEELLLYIIPLRFREDNMKKTKQGVQIEFIDLKEIKNNPKAEILHDILDGVPRFFACFPTQTVVNFQHAELPKTTMTHYCFKLKRILPLPRMLLRGKLHISTKCSEKAYQLFNDIIFGVQAVIITENHAKNKKEQRSNKKNKNGKNHLTKRKTDDFTVDYLPVNQSDNKHKNNNKNLDKKEKQRRDQKGSKAE